MPKHSSRRSFVATAASAIGVAGLGAHAQQTPPTFSADASAVQDAADREMLHMMLSEFELDPGNQGVSSTMAPILGGAEGKSNKITTARNAIKADPTKRYFFWPADDKLTFDYGHIVAMGPAVKSEGGADLATGYTNVAFPLTPAVLRRMMAANYFDNGLNAAHADPRVSNRVIVALRGCEIVGDGSGATGIITLRDIRPDHRNPRCVFIAWHRAETVANDTISAYAGSTVPSEIYLALYQTVPTNRNLRSCMMPQGLHKRLIGNMAVGDNIHSNTLRQISKTPVIREPNPDNSSFQVGVSVWDPNLTGAAAELVGAHVHAAFWDTKDDYWKYSSAGCQVICGSVTGATANRAIADFYKAMDIPAARLVNNKYTSGKYGAIFPIAILSGREARLHAQGALLSAMRRIRIGSSIDKGEEPSHAIIKVQHKLGGAADGHFGASSLQRLVALQADKQRFLKPFPDGIVTPEFAHGTWQISL